MESSSLVITPKDVLDSLMNDGMIGTLRLNIINQLKSDEDLKKGIPNTPYDYKNDRADRVRFSTHQEQKKTKRELFDALRQELETPMLEKASKSIWELILDGLDLIGV
ncbi:hypothetical protein Hdeb2414_s0012g00381691 [Helianthus debilis subsp. tardiflorus]